jgi:hypothetical protein
MRQIDPHLKHLSDAEVELLRTDLYEMAQLACEVWWHEKNGSKNPVGLLQDPDNTPTV